MTRGISPAYRLPLAARGSSRGRRIFTGGANAGSYLIDVSLGIVFSRGGAS